MQLGATLYVKNSVEAVAFYMEAFGMTLGYHARHPDGTFLHAELHKDGREIFAVSESSDDAVVQAMLAAHPPTMSYGIDFQSRAEVDKAFAMLADGGHVLRPLGALPWSPWSADVVDRFGVYWYITLPQHRPED
jgi:PhnB protein